MKKVTTDGVVHQRLFAISNIKVGDQLMYGDDTDLLLFLLYSCWKAI